MSLRVLYGLPYAYNDVTHRVWKHIHDETLVLPGDDYNRAIVLSDPLPGIVKEVFVQYQGKSWIFLANENINLPLPGIQVPPLNPKAWKNIVFPTAKDKLQCIHDNLYFEDNFNDEYPEQLLIAEFIKPHHVVLEIGANVGRSTLVTASLLDDDRNLVTMECDPTSVITLTRHRDANNMHFAIEPSALSSFPLYQKGWDTFYEYNKPEDAQPINTITYAEFKSKYPLPFDTLVADCEGALLAILGESPEILDGITMIIMENDYHKLEHKLEVDRILKSKGLVLHKNVAGGWGPCAPIFYQVWKADTALPW